VPHFGTSATWRRSPQRRIAGRTFRVAVPRTRVAYPSIGRGSASGGRALREWLCYACGGRPTVFLCSLCSLHALHSAGSGALRSVGSAGEVCGRLAGPGDVEREAGRSGDLFVTALSFAVARCRARLVFWLFAVEPARYGSRRSWALEGWGADGLLG
jgi:hypothetical protein